MRAWSVVLVVVWLGGCATALKREGECLASLAPEFVNAHEQLASLEASWRAALLKREAEGEAYARLMEAKVRHRPTLEWYGKVMKRFRTRLDEEQILSEVRFVLMTGPALIFYPVVRWNVHSVIWDGTDPDAESDPVTRYCTDRLSTSAASGLGRSSDPVQPAL